MKKRTVKPSMVCLDNVELQCEICDDIVVDINISSTTMVEGHRGIGQELVCNNLNCRQEYEFPANLMYITPVFKRRRG